MFQHFPTLTSCLKAWANYIPFSFSALLGECSHWTFTLDDNDMFLSRSLASRAVNPEDGMDPQATSSLLVIPVVIFIHLCTLLPKPVLLANLCFPPLGENTRLFQRPWRQTAPSGAWLTIEPSSNFPTWLSACYGKFSAHERWSRLPGIQSPNFNGGTWDSLRLETSILATHDFIFFYSFLFFFFFVDILGITILLEMVIYWLKTNV